MPTSAPPPGDHDAKDRDRLTQAVQSLHRAAGLPSSRAISSAVRDRDDLRDTVSHETVSAILRGEGLPRWIKLECVVRQLADWAAHRPDPDLVVREIMEIWLSCRQPADGVTAAQLSPPEVSREIAVQSALEHDVRVLSEEARLRFHQDLFEVTVTRTLLNNGSTPLSTFPMGLSAERFPGNPEKSMRHHREHPLTWSELSIEATFNGRPMAWRATTDRPAEKRLDLLFENESERFPLPAGDQGDLVYSYTIPKSRWGPFFRRKISLPTDRLGVTLSFPATLRPVVWAARVDPIVGDVRTRYPLTAVDETDGLLTFRWEPHQLVLRSAYQIEWGFRNPAPHTDS